MTLLRINTPLEDHLDTHGLLVKREDLACAPPGPPFSKTRGVFAHVRKRYEEGVRTFGVLDTYHSQAGHAVAAACRELGDPAVRCLNFYPVYKGDFQLGVRGAGDVQLNDGSVVSLREPQKASSRLGAQLRGLPAGRSAILYHAARRATEAEGGYMMPNALKLPETVSETHDEVTRTYMSADRETRKLLVKLPWLVAASSGTIAAGVLAALKRMPGEPRLVLHMGYSRSREATLDYVHKAAGPGSERVDIVYVDEGYAYKDVARPDKPGGLRWSPPPFPCNSHYDLKAWRWWSMAGRLIYDRAVLWNIG